MGGQEVLGGAEGTFRQPSEFLAGGVQVEDPVLDDQVAPDGYERRVELQVASHGSAAVVGVVHHQDTLSSGARLYLAHDLRGRAVAGENRDPRMLHPEVRAID